MEEKTLVAYASCNHSVFIRLAAPFHTKFCCRPFYLFAVLDGIIGKTIWDGYSLEW